MKRKGLIASVFPLLLAAGCAHSPRYVAVPADSVVVSRSPKPAVVVPAPKDAVAVVPAPVSNRPVMRVYPLPSTTLPAGVTPTEHAIAETIRTMFNDDPAWADLTDRVEVRVHGTQVDLNGTVVNDGVRDRIAQKIAGIEGVTRVENGLRVVSPSGAVIR